jgi:predicted nicotinamide N-methyase
MECGQRRRLGGNGQPAAIGQVNLVPVNPPSDLPRRRQRLLWRIHRHYQTVTRPLKIQDLSLQFTRIADPDVVLDQVAAQEDLRLRWEAADAPKPTAQEPLHLPYWAELWDSALGLGTFLVHHYRQRLAAMQVLDLGCGMGLAGTVAAALGAQVTLADLENPALLFAALNSLPYRGRVTVRQLDWRTDQLPQTFGLLLGSDILYERTQWPFLDRFWRRHLTADGAVLLGEPGRQTGDGFIEWIQQQGWALRQHRQAVPTRGTPIRVFELSVPTPSCQAG